MNRDSYLVFARKYRPQVFEEVVGQPHVTRTLKNALLAGRVAHAFLFSGTRGVGKTTVARILAKALNCERGPAAEPCNQCPSCSAVMEGRALDVLEIDGASHRGINETKEVIENLRYQPIEGKFRIAIIDEVHQLTDAAFNALLKTLEEPPPHVKFIFATTDPEKVPDTIRSRCQCFVFRRVSLSEVAGLVEGIAESEGMEISRGAVQVLARAAEGSLRDAQSLLDQLRTCLGDRIDETMARDFLGVIDPVILEEIVDSAITGDAGKSLRLVHAALEAGLDVMSLIEGLVGHIRSLMVCSLIPGPEEFLGVSAEEAGNLEEKAAKAKTEKWHECLKIMLDVEQGARRALNPRTLLEMGLVRISHLPRWGSLDELMTRIADMENRLITGKDQASTGQNRTGEQGGAKAMEQGRGTDGWKEFLSFLREEKAFLATRLERVQVLDFREESVEIGEVPGHYLDYLKDPENLSLLKGCAKRFFQRDIQFVVKPTFQVQTPVPASGGSPPAELSHQEWIQEALRVFGGTVREPSPGRGEV